MCFGGALQRGGAKPEDFSSKKNPYPEKHIPANEALHEISWRVVRHTIRSEYIRHVNK